MYVCICNAVSEKKIRDYIGKSKQTPKEVCAKLKIGSDCGQCVEEALSIIEDSSTLGQKASQCKRNAISLYNLETK